MGERDWFEVGNQLLSLGLRGNLDGKRKEGYERERRRKDGGMGGGKRVNVREVRLTIKRVFQDPVDKHAALQDCHAVQPSVEITATNLYPAAPQLGFEPTERANRTHLCTEGGSIAGRRRER